MEDKQEQLEELVEEHTEKKAKNKKKLDPRELSKDTKRKDW